MSDTPNNPKPAETPVNQGGGNAPLDAPTDDPDALVAAETPVNQGGGSAE